jgi:hypothetical protein
MPAHAEEAGGVALVKETAAPFVSPVWERVAVSGDGETAVPRVEALRSLPPYGVCFQGF